MLLIKTIPELLVYSFMTLTGIKFTHMSISGSIVLHIYVVTVKSTLEKKISKWLSNIFSSDYAPGVILF